MANKAERLRDLTRQWRDDAASTFRRPDTNSTQDAERSKTLTECAEQVEKIVNDHKQD